MLSRQILTRNPSNESLAQRLSNSNHNCTFLCIVVADLINPSIQLQTIKTPLEVAEEENLPLAKDPMLQH